MSSIGENIKKLRKEKGMNQFDFAKSIGISRSYLGDLENNRKSPSLDTLQQLSKKMDVSINYLLEGEEFSNEKLIFTSNRISELSMEFEFNEKYLVQYELEFKQFNDIFVELIIPENIEQKFSIVYSSSYYILENGKFINSDSFMGLLIDSFDSENYSNYHSFLQNKIIYTVNKYVNNNQSIKLDNSITIPIKKPVFFAVYNEVGGFDFSFTL